MPFDPNTAVLDEPTVSKFDPSTAKLEEGPNIIDKVKTGVSTYLKEAQPAFKLAVQQPQTMIGKQAIDYKTGKPLTPEQLEQVTKKDWADIYRGANLPFSKSKSMAGQIIPQAAGMTLELGTKPSSYIIPKVAEGLAIEATQIPAVRSVMEKQLPTMTRGLLKKYPIGSVKINQDVTKTLEPISQKLSTNKGGQFPQRTQNLQQSLDKTIDVGINKAIRPSVIGKATASQNELYQQKARDAVVAITRNKNNLEFIDEAGQIENKLPESLNELSSAIEQTKNSIFNSYNSIAKEAGDAGAVVQLSPISQELLKLNSNKALNTLHPEIIKYATTKANALQKAGAFTAEEAQNALKILNDSLQAYYKNPSYDTARKAVIDSMIANNLRRSLDSVIEQTTGKQYQVLKNTYGALKSIEKDVLRRSIVDARKNIKGLIDFTDVFSGSDIMRGLVRMNPSDIASGLTKKMIATYIKSLNDPNRIIKFMFRRADKILEKLPTR